MVIDPITPSFAAEVGDVDLSQPLGDEQLEQIQEAFWTYAVLVFPGQHLSTEQHLEFARRFGPLQTSIEQYRPGSKLRVPAEIADVSNLTAGDKIWEAASARRLHEMGNRLWHTDASFRLTPALASLLYARSIPPVGGRTEFADLRAAYAALPESQKRDLEGLIAEHCIRFSRADRVHGFFGRGKSFDAAGPAKGGADASPDRPKDAVSRLACGEDFRLARRERPGLDR